jgi:putative lipase involved disintegration of autophagic bodies
MEYFCCWFELLQVGNLMELLCNLTENSRTPDNQNQIKNHERKRQIANPINIKTLLKHIIQLNSIHQLKLQLLNQNKKRREKFLNGF